MNEPTHVTTLQLDTDFAKAVFESAISAKAGVLWFRAAPWSGDAGTGGIVDDDAIIEMGYDESDADELVSAGFWARTNGGYRILGFHGPAPDEDGNPTVWLSTKGDGPWNPGFETAMHAGQPTE